MRGALPASVSVPLVPSQVPNMQVAFDQRLSEQQAVKPQAHCCLKRTGLSL